MKTNTAIQPQLRYCREKKAYCTNANWYGECSITACDKVMCPQKRYGNTAKQVIIDERSDIENVKQAIGKLGDTLKSTSREIEDYVDNKDGEIE